ncbi:hypothetical protein GCM10027446_01300 [Angustibacter peucedani]
MCRREQALADRSLESFPLHPGAADTTEPTMFVIAFTFALGLVLALSDQPSLDRRQRGGAGRTVGYPHELNTSGPRLPHVL